MQERCPAPGIHNNNNKQYQCSCEKSSMETVTMKCKALCGHFCNSHSNVKTRKGDVCGKEEYDHVYDVEGKPVVRADHFIYTKGVNNQLSIVERECSLEDCKSIDDLTCNTCSVHVGTMQTCRQCEMISCEDGSQAPLIDCGNIEANSIFNLCEPASIPPRDGIFSKLSSEGFDECADKSPTNDACSSQSKLILPGEHSTLGITSHAMLDDAPICQGASDSPGLWYRVIGTGRGLVASTCGDHTDFDTLISVYKGECDNLECVYFNNDASHEYCGVGQSSVGFFGEDGVEYHIKVSGFESSSGLFEFSVVETDLAVDECQAAKRHHQNLAESHHGLNCGCQATSGGHQQLSCADSCEYCNIDETVCSTRSFSEKFFKKGMSHSKTISYAYAKGRNNTIEVNEYNCEGDKCKRCDVIIDGEQCTSCEMEECSEEGSVHSSGMSLNCSNIEAGAVFSECNGPTQFDSGLLQTLSQDSFRTCQQDPMTKCTVLAEQYEELSEREETSCHCDGIDDSSATLTCSDTNCRFCNAYGDVCSNITYGQVVTDSREEGLATKFREFQYVHGRNETLRYEEHDGSCSFFMNGTLCKACETVSCNGAIEDLLGISVDCTNIHSDAIFSECVKESATGSFEVFSENEFEHCIEGIDPSETCLQLKKYEEMYGFDRNTTCECSSNPITGEHTLTCTDTACVYCNHHGTVCAKNVYGYSKIGRYQQPAYFNGYHYIPEKGGRQEKIIMEYENDECRVFVDDQECSTCERKLCIHETHGHLFEDVRANCENLEGGISFDGCDKVFVDTGVFEVVSDNEFNNCIIPRSPEEACRSEASMQESQTEGVTCKCSPSDSGGVDMTCLEQGCLYCSADRMVCGYETFGTSFNQMGHPIYASNGFKFVSGRDGHLTFRLETDPSEVRECMVSFNGEECSSCAFEQCHSYSKALRVDCSNLQAGSFFDQCEFEQAEGTFLDYFSPVDFQYCMDTGDPMEFCESQRDFAELADGRGRGTACECSSESGELQLSCADTQCLYCTFDEAVCKVDVLHGGTISNFGFFVNSLDVSQYVQGRQERIAIEKRPDGFCAVYIDGMQCTSCEPEVCADEHVELNIDCENVKVGARHRACQLDRDEGGVFVALSDTSFQECFAFEGSLEDITVQGNANTTPSGHSNNAQLTCVILSLLVTVALLFNR